MIKNLLKILLISCLVMFGVTANAQNQNYSLWEPQEGGNTATVSSNYEVGTRITFDVPGYVTGVRFWKEVHNTGLHKGTLWSNAGGLIAQVTFTGETASGWQTMLFTTPQHVLANTVYVVSYNWNTGTNWTGLAGGMTPGIKNGPVNGVASGGRYITTQGLFPTSGGADAYYADVMFVPDGPTGINFSMQVNHTFGLTTRTDATSYELGHTFTTTALGSVTALKYWKMTGGAATHELTLWNKDTGVMLATTWTTAETATGWQIAPLSVPVILIPEVNYMVSWHRAASEPLGYKAVTFPITNGPLTETGFYYYTGTGVVLPATNGNSFFYSVDVIFEPAFAGLFQ